MITYGRYDNAGLQYQTIWSDSVVTEGMIIDDVLVEQYKIYFPNGIIFYVFPGER